jgi:hypothetical protein
MGQLGTLQSLGAIAGVTGTASPEPRLGEHPLCPPGWGTIPFAANMQRVPRYFVEVRSASHLGHLRLTGRIRLMPPMLHDAVDGSK